MRLRCAAFALALAACASDAEPASSASDAGQSVTLPLRAPAFGPVPEPPRWRDNEPNPARVELGRSLFFDKRLSRSGQTHCNSCHNYLSNFQDALPRAIPDRSYPSDRPVTERNSSSLLNLVYAPRFRWDGSASDLWAVSAFPFSEANMDLGADVPSAQRALRGRLGDIEGYVASFDRAYGVDIRQETPEAVWTFAGKAIAQYLRAAVSRNARFDRWNAGDDSAMNEAEVRGFELFRGAARCSGCHSGPLFSDFGFHNVSSALPNEQGEREDEGRFLITGEPADRGRFLTPTLRSSWDTAPYFHDGSVASLRAVIVHKTSAAGRADPRHSPVLDGMRPLSAANVDDLVAFLGALRGEKLKDMQAPATFPE